MLEYAAINVYTDENIYKYEIYNEWGFKLTDRHNSSVSFANGRTLKKKLALGKFFFSFFQLFYIVEVVSLIQYYIQICFEYIQISDHCDPYYRSFLVSLIQFLYFYIQICFEYIQISGHCDPYNMSFITSSLALNNCEIITHDDLNWK